MNWVEFYESIDLHVRWSDKQDLVLNVNPRDSVYSIKEKIQHSTGNPQRKYIRLIHNGKVLSDSQTLKSYGIGKKTNGIKSPFYINCSLSDYIPPNQMTSNVISAAEFDKLRESGFTEQDIQNLQMQFQQLHISKKDQSSSMDQNESEGTSKDMILGFLLGLFLGIICLFLFRKSTFSKRKQWGIFVGTVINISFGIFQVYY